jgi:hypothetical protein
MEALTFIPIKILLVGRFYFPLAKNYLNGNSTGRKAMFWQTRTYSGVQQSEGNESWFKHPINYYLFNSQ